MCIYMSVCEYKNAFNFVVMYVHVYKCENICVYVCIYAHTVYEPLQVWRVCVCWGGLLESVF